MHGGRVETKQEARHTSKERQDIGMCRVCPPIYVTVSRVSTGDTGTEGGWNGSARNSERKSSSCAVFQVDSP